MSKTRPKSHDLGIPLSDFFNEAKSDNSGKGLCFRTNDLLLAAINDRLVEICQFIDRINNEGSRDSVKLIVDCIEGFHSSLKEECK